MARKKTVAPGLTDKTHQWYSDNFDNLNQGAQYALEAFPELYGRTLSNLRGIFSAGELSLILDAQNGCLLVPQIAGQHICPDVEDGIMLEDMEQKWKINGAALVKKLHTLTTCELAMLEIWAGAFWQQKKPDIEKWVSGLVAKKPEGS